MKYAIFNYLVLQLLCNMLLMSRCKRIDIAKVEVVGPGLFPDTIVMPARYFFVYAWGKNDFVKTRLGNVFDVEIHGHSEDSKHCRSWINVLDRKDGSFIVRYKLYNTCTNFEIHIRYKGKHVALSPYKIKDNVQPEDCYCPMSSITDWLERFGCSSSGSKYYRQINEDLKPFLAVNFDKFHTFAVDKFNTSRSTSVCNYAIVKNQVYRECYGQHVGFNMFMDAILLSLARKVQLPDMEMFVNLGDWPLVKTTDQPLIPMFSWCGSKASMDIVMPTYDLTQAALECMGRVSLDMLSVQGNIEKEWSQKNNQAFWRGRDSSRERLKLIDIARQHPQLINASLTNFFFFRNEEHKYGPKEKPISFFKFFDFKYQLNLDGTVAAYRFPYLLAGDSVVFKQESDYYEHFYGDLKPWYHFVPVKKNLSDLVDRITWAIQNDDEAQRIARNGQEYARENLLSQHIFCYHAVLFQEWSKRVVSDVHARAGMVHVPQPEVKACKCQASSRKEEL